MNKFQSASKSSRRAALVSRRRRSQVELIPVRIPKAGSRAGGRGEIPGGHVVVGVSLLEYGQEAFGAENINASALSVVEQTVRSSRARETRDDPTGFRIENGQVRGRAAADEQAVMRSVQLERRVREGSARQGPGRSHWC